MKEKKPFVILFAGAVGSSKSPIAHHLSWNFQLPLFNRDIVRTEVVEDLGRMDKEEFERRSDVRLGNIISQKINLIYDASIDRKWSKLRDEALDKYDCYIISIDLSKEFLMYLYEVKKYDDSKKLLDKFHEEHEIFLRENHNDINLHITEKEFPDRLEFALKNVREWLENR